VRETGPFGVLEAYLGKFSPKKKTWPVIAFYLLKSPWAIDVYALQKTTL